MTRKIGLASVVGALSDTMFFATTEEEAIEALRKWAEGYVDSGLLDRCTPAADAFIQGALSPLLPKPKKTISPKSKRPVSMHSLQSLLP